MEYQRGELTEYVVYLESCPGNKSLTRPSCMPTAPEPDYGFIGERLSADAVGLYAGGLCTSLNHDRVSEAFSRDWVGAGSRDVPI